MEALERAMSWANEHYNSASVQHKAAFANSVSYLVTGASGGYGGPSMREHLVSWSLGSHCPMPGQWDFEQACAHAAPLCFEPAKKHLALLMRIQETHCFDDDPADLAVLRGKA